MSHPMIEAIGEEEFKKGLSEMPNYFEEKYRDNFKFIGMQLIWEERDKVIRPVTPRKLKSAKDLIQDAYDFWVYGLSREEAVLRAIKESKS